MTVLLAAVAFLVARDELSDAIAKLKEGYAFTLHETNETIPGREPALALDGAWAKEAPLKAVAGGLEMYRLKALVWRPKDGEWKRFDPKAGVRADDQEPHALLSRVLALRLPHDELDAVAKALRNAKKTADGGVEGDLAAEAAIDVLCNGRATPMPAHQTGHAGRVRIWREKGAITKVDIAITWTETGLSHVGESGTNVTWRKTIELKEVGTAKVEVPAAARKLLE